MYEKRDVGETVEMRISAAVWSDDLGCGGNQRRCKGKPRVREEHPVKACTFHPRRKLSVYNAMEKQQTPPTTTPAKETVHLRTHMVGM